MQGKADAPVPFHETPAIGARRPKQAPRIIWMLFEEIQPAGDDSDDSRVTGFVRAGRRGAGKTAPRPAFIHCVVSALGFGAAGMRGCPAPGGPPRFRDAFMTRHRRGSIIPIQIFIFNALRTAITGRVAVAFTRWLHAWRPELRR
ncbi:MAG: hypothetical protein LBV73_19390 [Paraburkholderia sp.]|nr:hypothetical protein [Paraburkholderia sp.]